MILATTCHRCPLATTRSKVVWGSGNSSSNVMFVAEAPGKTEDKFGFPFVDEAPAGKEFNYLLSQIGLPRDNVYVTNMVKCHPPGDRDPTAEEQQQCLLWLEEEINRVGPKYLVTVGRVATRHFLGDVDMESVHGIPYHDPYTGLIVIPVYHPAAGLHHPETMIMVQSDFRTVREVVFGRIPPVHVKDEFAGNEQYTEITDDNLYQSPYIDELVSSSIIATDTEWARGKPWCLSFSVSPGTAAVVMADQPRTISFLNQQMNKPHTLTIGHNLLYDLPVLDQMGVFPPHIADTMVMAYLLQTEPQGLKVLSYRHLGMKMTDYSDMVGSATRSNAISYLQHALTMSWPDSQPILVWEKGQPKVKKPWPISKKIKKILDDVAKKGDEVDPYSRWMNIGKNEGRGLVETTIGHPMWEGDLSDIDRSAAIHYSARDADSTLRLYSVLWPRIVADGLEPTFWADMGAMRMVSDMVVKGFAIDPEHFAALGGYLEERVGEIQNHLHDQLWQQGINVGNEVINPNSSQRVSELLYGKSGFKLNTDRYWQKFRGSTEDDVLARMVGMLPQPIANVVQTIRDWRSLSKNKTSFSDVMPLKADSNNRIHATMRITRTTTGRLSCSDPNLMAIPTRTAEGRKIRDGFVADPGCSLVSMDYSQVEMRVVCHCAKDPIMTEIFLTGQDIHSRTASEMFGIAIPDLDEMKHRYPAKRVGFGVLNDLSPEGLQREMLAGGASASDWPVDRCEELIKNWFGVYKGIKQYMLDTRTHAKRYGYVVDMWGRRRYIPHARSQNTNLREEALRQAGNAPIQMGAQGVIKRAMAKLVPIYREYWRKGINWYYIVQIHDDLLSNIPDSHLAEIIPLAKSIMEGVGKEEMSVPLIADAKVGKRWGSLEKWPPKPEQK